MSNPFKEIFDSEENKQIKLQQKTDDEKRAQYQRQFDDHRQKQEQIINNYSYLGQKNIDLVALLQQLLEASKSRYTMNIRVSFFEYKEDQSPADTHPHDSYYGGMPREAEAVMAIKDFNKLTILLFSGRKHFYAQDLLPENETVRKNHKDPIDNFFDNFEIEVIRERLALRKDYKKRLAEEVHIVGIAFLAALKKHSDSFGEAEFYSGIEIRIDDNGVWLNNIQLTPDNITYPKLIELITALIKEGNRQVISYRQQLD